MMGYAVVPFQEPARPGFFRFGVSFDIFPALCPGDDCPYGYDDDFIEWI
jgi:hypothetical protein